MDGTNEHAYLAVDLGATSGRVILGIFREDELRLEELHRFEQPVERAGGHQRWVLPALLAEVETGLRAAGAQTLVDPATIRSVGVDSWGVDFGLLDASGELVENPVCYRDSRTDGKLEELLTRIPAAELYARTGIQLMSINTLFQLFAQVSSGEWPANAARFLMIPDLVHHHLCGRTKGEFTIASTSQILRAGQAEWDTELLAAAGVPAEVMPELVQPGTLLGPLREELRKATGLTRLEVVAPSAHDTASAVVGTPLEEGWAYLSSGTWSLLGVETHEPVLGEAARAHNFTNEGGAFGTNRLLKNVTGLWILEQCRKRWREEGLDVGYETLLAGLDPETPGSVFIDPDDPRFLNPADMVAELRGYLSETGQAVPADHIGVTRVILESLAKRFAEVVGQLEEITGRAVRGVHIVGGGSQNSFLSRATSVASGLPVRTGPVEATAIGNLLVQGIRDDLFPDLPSAREWLGRTLKKP